MNILNNEEKLLLIIKLGPLFFVFIISSIITQISLSEQKKSYQNNLEIIEKNYSKKDAYSNYEKEKKTELLKLKTEITNKTIYTSLLLMLIFSIFSYFISKYIEKILTKYKESLKKEMEIKVEKEKILIQQSKMAAMGEMIGNIVHQWKQPLNLIAVSNGLLKISQEKENFTCKKDINKAIDNIGTSVQYLSTTIDDFRNFFKPEKEKRNYDLETIFEKTLKLIISELKNNNIKIIKNIKSFNLYGYPNELLQVLINIIKNAKDELIKLEKNKTRLLFIYTFKENDNVIIKIKDNAGGIPENIIDRIFEAYFTTKSQDEGTGIGLYMSKRIIEGMNGKLSVVNCEYDFKGIKYKGAEFTLELRLKNKDNISKLSNH